MVKQEVEKGTLPAMQKMLGHSKYVWTGVADDHALLTEGRESYDEEDPLTWATMLTGINSRMHRIKDYSYTPDFMIGMRRLLMPRPSCSMCRIRSRTY